ncbi:MAG: hypothetical protein JXR61_13405 [Prolixibacteraceae bacterium]|nr:hypothetical protein [Prolixibacteraceae bacterium]
MEDTENLKEATFSDLFELNLDNFLEELSALNDTFPMELALLSIKHKQLIEKLEKISIVIEEEEGGESESKKVRYKANVENFEEFTEIHKHLQRTDIAKKIIPRNFVVSNVSQYDAFLGELVKTLYEVNSNIIRSCEKDLKIEELFNYDSIEELKEHIVDKEVESLLREEHYEQLKILEKRITKVTGNNFTLTTNLPVLPEFVELTQRRNLFVHTNGFTNRQYLEAKRKWNFQSECTEELSEELGANPKYCERAFQVLFEMAVKLTHVLWRKFVPAERENADDHLNQVIYDLLVDEEYDLAIEIANFGTNVIKKFSSEQIRKFIIINKAIAYKMKNKDKECQKVIKNEDWSIGNEFKLAKLVLEDNFIEAKELMIRIGDTEEILNRKAYEKWPLFRQFRKTEEFKSGYKELYNEEFTVEEIQDKVETEEAKEEKVKKKSRA